VSFHQYIASLPKWDHALIKHLDFGTTDIDDILPLLTNPLIELILGSDGGAKDRLGSFGALLASQEGPHGTTDAILAEIGGAACGDTPRSFRAESYGQLAIVRLLFHISRHYGITIRCRCRFLLDNSGRLKRTRTILQQPQPPPRRYLLSDFDVDMQIRATIQHLGLTTTDEHIHSHQAPPQPGEPIPWKTQINERCDAIATDHLERQTAPIINVPFLPASIVQLNIRRRTITSRLPTQIRQLCGSHFSYSNRKSQRQYLQRLHAWSPHIFQTIDWTAFDNITNKKSSFPSRLFKIRWMNHILPLQARQHRMQLSPNAHCTSDCGCQHEDDSHLLRCSHPARQALYPKLVTDLHKIFSRHHVDPWLRQILLSGIAVVHPPTTFNLTTLTNPYRTLATGQGLLGPHALFYGIFHQSWIPLQEAYLRTIHKPTDRNQGRQAVELIALHFQATARAQWDIRNQHLHETHDSLQPYVRTLLSDDIKLIYAQLPDILPLDRPAITQGILLNDRLQQPTNRLRHWLRHVRPIFKTSLQQATTRPPHTMDIRTFFHNVRPPEPTG
jgi:hypothetical protein